MLKHKKFYLIAHSIKTGFLSTFLLLFFQATQAQDQWSDLSSAGKYHIDVLHADETTPRSVFVHVPDGSPGETFPVIVWLHGSMPDTVNAIESNKGIFKDFPETLKFIGVIPHSLASVKKDGTGGQLVWNHAPNSDRVTVFPKGIQFVGKDITFLNHIIDQVKANASVKTGNSIYFMGHSSGGFMTLRMGMNRDDCGGISPSGASFHKGSGYVDGIDGFNQNVDYSSLVPRSLNHSVRYVHVQGECDNLALWDGNLDAQGQTPQLSTGGTTDCENEASKIPIYPILGDENTEGAAWLWAENNKLVSNSRSWTIEDGIHRASGTPLDFTQYSIRIPGGDDVIVIKFHGDGHASKGISETKEDRIKLLLGTIKDLPGIGAKFSVKP